MTDTTRPPLPPFDVDSAILTICAAEDSGNPCSPQRVALAYSSGRLWRNRAEFITGRAQIAKFLIRNREKENDYKLIKELWTFGDARVAVRFAYEWQLAGLCQLFA